MKNGELFFQNALKKTKNNFYYCKEKFLLINFYKFLLWTYYSSSFRRQTLRRQLDFLNVITKVAVHF